MTLVRLRVFDVGLFFLFHVVWSLNFNVGSYCFTATIKTRKATPLARKKRAASSPKVTAAMKPMSSYGGLKEKPAPTPAVRSYSADSPLRAQNSDARKGVCPNGHRAPGAFLQKQADRGENKEKGSPRGKT